MDHCRSDADFTLTHVKQQCRKTRFVFDMTALVSTSVNPVQHQLGNYNRIPMLSYLLSYSVHSVRLESNGGNPHATGSKSSREFSTMWACKHFALSTLLSGTMTTFIPAARAAATPFGASSNTRTSSGDFGGVANLEEASWKISGAGLHLLRFGSSFVTVCDTSWKRSLWFVILLS